MLAIVPAVHASAAEPQCEIKRGKIVGGGDALIAAWPGYAALRLYSAEGRVAFYFCGGTAITDRWVLTAAHCMHQHLSSLTATVYDKDGAAREARLEAVLETEDLTKASDDRTIAIDKVIVHETYEAALRKALAIEDEPQRRRALSQIAAKVGNDVALVHLARPWSGRTAKLSLSAASDPVAEAGVQVRTAGFGMTSHNKYSSQPPLFDRADKSGILYAGSSRLQETAVETVAPNACRKRYPTDQIGDGQLCAGHEQAAQDSCQGDSGGPLAVVDAGNCPRQIGVVSWGVGCADRDSDGGLYYGVYTRVSAFQDWIQRHAGPLQGATTTLGDGSPESLSPQQLAEGMAQLQATLGDGRGRVSIGIRGGNRVKVGDKVVFEASSTIGGRLILLDVNAAREVMLLYPNKFVATGETGAIAAGARVAVPGPDYPGFTSFQAVEPVGKGRIIALVAPHDFDVTRFAADGRSLNKGFVPRSDPSSYLMRLIRQIEIELADKSGPGSGAGKQQPRWGYAVEEYDIIR